MRQRPVRSGGSSRTDRTMWVVRLDEDGDSRTKMGMNPDSSCHMGKESTQGLQECMTAVDCGWVASWQFHGLCMHSVHVSVTSAPCCCPSTLPAYNITQPHQCNHQLYHILLYVPIAAISPMACISLMVDALSSSPKPFFHLISASAHVRAMSRTLLCLH